MFAATTYDAAKIMVEAIKSAEDKGLTAGSDEYKQAVIDAIKGTDIDGVTGHFTFDDNNNPIKDVLIITIKDGNYSLHSKF